MARRRNRSVRDEIDDLFARTIELEPETTELQKRSVSRGEGVKRVSWGFHLRPDLIKRVKMLAVSEGRKIYEVVEDALESYLENHEI